MLSELDIYERRLDRLDDGLPPFSLSLGGDGYIPTLVEASTLEECLDELDEALSRVNRNETVIVEDLVSGRVYRGPALRILNLVRSRTLFDTMI